jgi:outer membrane biosynthesis protein TonB
VTGASDGQYDLRQREFRRFVGWSAGAHVAVFAFALISPSWGTRIDPSQVIAVDLVSMPASALPSPPAPAAPKAPSPPAEKAVPPPPPEPPKPKEIVIPKNPEREPSKPKPKPKEVTPQPKPQPEKDLEDLLADMRKDAGETAPTPAPAAPQETAAAPTGVGGAATVAVSPEELAWIRKAKLQVEKARVVPPGFKMQDLQTRVIVELDGSGALVGEPRITQRSGNPWYDEEVLRSIMKSSPLPPPPRAGEWEFVFLPEDAF